MSYYVFYGVLFLMFAFTVATIMRWTDYMPFWAHTLSVIGMTALCILSMAFIGLGI